MIRLNLFMICFLHFLSLLSVICRYYRQNSSSRIIVVLVYTVSTLFSNTVRILYRIKRFRGTKRLLKPSWCNLKRLFGTKLTRIFMVQ